MKPINVDILQLIPQRPPFVMVDKLTDFTEESVTTELNIATDNIFLDNDRMLPVGLIENMAQTCAVRIGYMAWLKGLPIQIGLVGAVKNFQLLEQPRANDTLTTIITVIGKAFQMLLVEAETSVNGKLMAKAELKIALTDGEIE